MNSSAQFAQQVQFALLLMGPPFSGKTNIAFQFPDPYFLDCDDKLGSAVRRNPGKEFYWDCPLRGDKGHVVDPINRWNRSITLLKAAVADPRIKTIVIDSGTALQGFLIDYIVQQPSTAKTPLTVGGEKVMDRSMWGPYRDLLTKLILGLRACGKYVIFCMHDLVDKDEDTKTTFIRPSFGGALRDTAGGLFTEHWHTETRQAPDLKNPGQFTIEYFVRCAPRSTMPLGTTMGLPPEFVFTWKAMAERLAYIAPQPTDGMSAAVQLATSKVLP